MGKEPKPVNTPATSTLDPTTTIPHITPVTTSLQKSQPYVAFLQMFTTIYNRNSRCKNYTDLSCLVSLLLVNDQSPLQRYFHKPPARGLNIPVNPPNYAPAEGIRSLLKRLPLTPPPSTPPPSSDSQIPVVHSSAADKAGQWMKTASARCEKTLDYERKVRLSPSPSFNRLNP